MSSPATSIPSLLLWTDVHASAAAFTPPLLILLSLTSISLVSILAWAALALLALVVGSRLYVYIMVNLLAKLPNDGSADPLSVVYDVDLTIPADKVAGLSHTATDVVNSTLGELRRLFLAESIIDTVKFGASLYCLTYIGSWFNLLTLLIVGWCALFALPKVYLNNQESVDETVGMVMEKVEGIKGTVGEIKEKVDSVVPIGGMKEE